MSAGLVASTVTPGITPPDVSLTVPARMAWACAVDGTSRSTHVSPNKYQGARINLLPGGLPDSADISDSPTQGRQHPIPTRRLRIDVSSRQLVTMGHARP